MPAVERYFFGGDRGEVQLEKLSSALWRLEVGVAELFSGPTAAAFC